MDDQKLIHAFGALAELGQEVTNKKSFQETMRTSLHLISGALGIMRGPALERADLLFRPPSHSPYREPQDTP